ncbi:restriction endonuclease PLD domain-containing protein [Moritella sp. 28]|uniref:restriction endonuclease PLD domain-containing protein n=1 Tax=Moritella sp. 28 TaxID=2746232 RepID=UPI001BA4E927|nr:restriction endonuclease PLD domain-containing protein [Moritella sp. 28]QUM84439.1 NgoFVII family restriction endonuclease [Moritella sp. 28]
MRIIAKPAEIDKVLVQLMKRYNKYHIATAWASMGSKASFELIKNKERIVRMVVGTHFFQTHPNFIEHFVCSDKVKFILKTDGVYHPKVYLFSSENGDWECLIGSANFTASALTKNNEIVIHIKSDDSGSDEVFKDLIEAIDGYWSDSQSITEIEFKNYKNIWRKNRKKVDSLKGVYGTSKSKDALVKSELFSLEWSEYYKKIKDDELGSFNERLDVLSIIHQYFLDNESFSKFSQLKRKQVAGITSDPEVNWKWFGSMVGAGKFKNRINTNNLYISDALAVIPLIGPINKVDYDEFVNKFKLAFPDGGAGIAIASRLLAMKRPDYFVCLDKQNRSMLCRDFGIPATVTFETYWDNIIERIIDSVWWSSPRPIDSAEEQAWLGRAAMIDALFYGV